jgi:hypothetical protein
MGYRSVRTKQTYTSKKRWTPFKFGLCPQCEAASTPKSPTPPKEELEKEPPSVQEIRSEKSKSESKGDGGSEKGKESKEPKGGEGKGEGKGKEEEKGHEDEIEGAPPFNAKPEDMQRARQSSDDVKSDFQKVTAGGDSDILTPEFLPIASTVPPEVYRDTDFITKMRYALRDWRIGRKEFLGKTGTWLSIPDFIRSNKEEPFTSSVKKSAKGRKILVIIDLSESMEPCQEEYKTALISSMEVLDDIGTKTALYGFGSEMGSNASQIFFKVKRFEDPKWQPDHSAKIAALAARGGTPTAKAYELLEPYIRKHRPDVTLTITDGEPHEVAKTAEMVGKLKRHTRMVAYGIAPAGQEQAMEEMLKSFGYDRVFSVIDIGTIPTKLIKIIAPN